MSYPAEQQHQQQTAERREQAFVQDQFHQNSRSSQRATFCSKSRVPR
jgi:hypothetical protein